MADRKIPSNIRPLFDIEPLVIPELEAPQEIDDRKGESARVLKRLSAIIAEHQDASRGLNITIGEEEILIVSAALRDHAQGGTGELKLPNDDEIYAHCLKRLFEELVEEPSNILYTTKTGPDSMRYDAMNAPFWIECLDHLEQNASAIANQ